MRSLAIIGLLTALSVSSGCAPILPPQALGEVDAVRETPAVLEAKAVSPAVVAEAEKLRADAMAAFEADDLAGAQILAEEALAAYERAVAVARTARAEERRVSAAAEAEDKKKRLAEVEAELQQVQAAVRAADKRLEVLRELQPVTPSGPADPSREKARAAVVATLRLEALLLCSAGELLATERASEPGFVVPEAVAGAKASLAALDETLASKPTAAPIDQARRARADCLASLAAVRRAKGASASAPGASDRLLASLSEAGQGDPRRDDRGIVLTFHQLFDRDALSATGGAAVAAVAKVGGEHARFPLMVVIHHRGDEARWRKRGQALVTALRDELGAARVADPVLAGSAAPIVDPDGRYAARNERVEIVFISPRAL